MLTSIDAEQEQNLRALIRQHGLQDVEEHIVQRAQIAITLEAAPESTKDEIGATRLGGLPDVPDGWQWPEKLSFLAQINCAEIAPHDPQQRLPPQGLLLFFHNNMDYCEDGGLPHHVELIENTRELQRAKAPRGYLPRALMSCSGDGNEVYTPLRVVPRPRLSLPTLYSRDWREICAPDDSEDELPDDYLNLLGTIESEGERDIHQLFGHHKFMDGDADEEAWHGEHGVSGRLIGQGISDEEKARTLQNWENNLANCREKHDEAMALYYQKQRDNYLRYLEHKDEADKQLDEWTLLFQMDSDDRLHAMFNDAGFTYFMIRRDDLAAQRFDRVYNGMWSS